MVYIYWRMSWYAVWCACLCCVCLCVVSKMHRSSWYHCWKVFRMTWTELEIRTRNVTLTAPAKSRQLGKTACHAVLLLAIFASSLLVWFASKNKQNHVLSLQLWSNNTSLRNCILPFSRIDMLLCKMMCLQCFDTVGWAAGRASGL